MPIQVTCPKCFTRFSVSEKFAGKKGPCPKCKSEITVPDVGEEVVVPIGKADIKREGKDITLATVSYCVLQALEAAEELAAEYGIDVEVDDLRSVVPLDMETVYQSVQKTGRLLAVHESQANSGIGAEVVARIYEEAPHLLESPARRLGMAPASIPVSKPLEEELLPWKRKMKAAVLEMMLRPVAA